MALDMSRMINVLKAIQASKSMLDPDRETYDKSDPSPEFVNGEVVEVCFYIDRENLIDPNQTYYEGVVIGKTWNPNFSKWDWIIDFGMQIYKNTIDKHYKYQAMVVSQYYIVKDKPLEWEVEK